MRAEKIAQALVARGHEVKVLTAPARAGERGIRIEDRSLEVRTLRYPGNPRHLWIRARQLLGRSNGKGNGRSGGGAGGSSGFASRNGGGPSQLIRALLFLPDDQQGFGLAALTHGLTHAHASYDLIYSTAPPFSSHLAGYVLHRLTGTPWVAEFRDPWTNNPVNPKPRTGLTDALEDRFESAVIRTAERVVVGTRRLLNELAERHGPQNARKLLLVRNGIDTIAEEAPTPRPHSELLHLGTLYGARSAEFLLEGLARVLTSDSDPETLRVRFVGVDDDEQRQGLQALAERLGLARAAIFEAWQPRAEALRTLAAADFPILLAINQPAQVPNKLYEYLGTRKPIIALVDEDGESAHLLRRAGRHILLYQDTADAWESAFRRATALIRDHSSATSSTDALKLWSTERQFDRLVDVLEGKPITDE
ncbi:MAG: glycosyltransferase [Gemmatimonadota bacterium]